MSLFNNLRLHPIGEFIHKGNVHFCEKFEGKRPKSARSENDEEVTDGTGNDNRGIVFDDCTEEKFKGLGESRLYGKDDGKTKHKLDNTGVPHAVGGEVYLIFIKRIYDAKTDETANEGGGILTCTFIVMRVKPLRIQAKDIDKEANGKHGGNDNKDGHCTVKALLGFKHRMKKEHKTARNKQRYADVKRCMHAEIHTGEGGEHQKGDGDYSHPKLL